MDFFKFTIYKNSLLKNYYCCKYFSCNKINCKRKFSTDNDTPLISLDESHRFIRDCAMAVGAPLENACILADNLVKADYLGYFSHGMNRLVYYLDDIENGACDPCATPEILKQTPSVAWIDGNNGLGSVVGKFCMELAIQKARKCGVGWVVAKGSNHFGICAIYGIQAIEKKVIGLAFTNASPLMVPTRAKNAAIGTNPLCLAAPGCKTNILLDMAATAVSIGKIKLLSKLKSPIPSGWALDETGNVTNDSEKAAMARRLLPLGGNEDNSSYKGYGLGLLSEVLSGITAGSCWGPNIRKWGDSTTPSNLGHCFIAVDPENFAPGFMERVDKYVETLRCLEPVDPLRPIIVAGDKEYEHMAAVDKAGGVRYNKEQLKICCKLAEKLRVDTLKAA